MLRFSANQNDMAAIQASDYFKAILRSNLPSLTEIFEAFGAPNILRIIYTVNWHLGFFVIIRLGVLLFLGLHFLMLIRLKLFSSLFKLGAHCIYLHGLDFILSKIKVMAIYTVKSNAISPFTIAKAMRRNTVSTKYL